MSLIKAVVEQNKSFDQKQFREKIKNSTFCVKNYPGLLMDVHYDEKGDLDRESFLIKIDNQKQVMAGILLPSREGLRAARNSSREREDVHRGCTSGARPRWDI